VTQLDKDGEVVTTGIKKHPAFQILRDSATSFRQFAGDFGMTPSARTRLQLPDEAEQLSLFEEISALMESAAERAGVETGTSGD